MKYSSGYLMPALETLWRGNDIHEFTQGEDLKYMLKERFGYGLFHIIICNGGDKALKHLKIKIQYPKKDIEEEMMIYES